MKQSADTQKKLDALFEQLLQHKRTGIHKGKKIIPIRKWLPVAAAAAVVLLLLTISGFFRDPSQPGVKDIEPGSNRATLTLADGSTIHLSEAQHGIIVGDGITYFDGSPLFEKKPQNHTFTDSQLQLLTTPKGGTYQVTLPDSTK